MKHKYHPHILPHEAMEEQTSASLKALMDSHPKMPCLLARINEREKVINELSINHVILSNRISFEIQTLFLMRDELDMNLLARALCDVTVDRYISEHIEDTRQLHNQLDTDMGYFDLLIMPGVVRIVHPIPYQLAEDLAVQLSTGEIENSSPRFFNLGYFAAGTWGSAHEGMEVQSRVKTMEKIWGNFHREFNEHLSIAKKSPSIELSSPRLSQME